MYWVVVRCVKKFDAWVIEGSYIMIKDDSKRTRIFKNKYFRLVAAIMFIIVIMGIWLIIELNTLPNIGPGPP
jgi:hypothetical protein